uniref:Reverse transcriptase/retrotransposon-derived protein RNase H-like domain-containing protein n=1 Tax=Cajanus cajan TaxID=3821 RepID=A0A151SYG5_CAJCA|nr:hypothetical protein KK1_015249 [Cajanus cajan]
MIIKEVEQNMNECMKIFSIKHTVLENCLFMRIEGKVDGISILILIGNEAIHNFISSKLAKLLSLAHETWKMRVKLGDGYQVSSQGVCQQLEVVMGSYSYLVDAHVLEIGGLDLILGVAWLLTLGEVATNWNTMTMKFQENGQHVLLQGSDVFGLTDASLTFQVTMNEILGHLKVVLEVLQSGVFVGLTKVKVVLECPTPSNVKGVRTMDFDHLKQLITLAPIFALPNLSNMFEVVCDASCKGVDEVFMQEKKSMAYFSKALVVMNLSKFTYEKEIMALVLVIQHW